jgi:hypothetical protein
MIAEWWTSLSVIMKVLWGITLAASLIFVIQTVMTFIGADAGGDFDADAGGGLDVNMDDAASAMGTGMNLLTFRNLINFLLGFGWTFILLQKSISSTGVLLVISVLVGLALVAIVMYMFKWLSGMQQSGTIDVYKAAVGCQGKVYLTIPGERAGEGKVQITINNAVREYAAVTDGPTLKTGQRIRVVEVVSANTLLVEEINSVII